MTAGLFASWCSEHDEHFYMIFFYFKKTLLLPFSIQHKDSEYLTIPEWIQNFIKQQQMKKKIGTEKNGNRHVKSQLYLVRFTKRKNLIQYLNHLSFLFRIKYGYKKIIQMW